MPYVIKERSSWVWKGPPLFFSKIYTFDLVPDNEIEIPIDEFRDSEDKD